MEKNNESKISYILETVDEGGRIVLPREMRKLLDIKEGSRMQLGILEDKIVLSKYSPMNTLREWSGCIISALSSVIEHDILMCDTEKVVNASKKKYFSQQLTGDCQELIYKRDVVIKKQEEGSNMVTILRDSTDKYSCELIVPILQDNNVLGGLIVLAIENKCFNDDTVKVCKAFSQLLSCLVE